jgi:Ca2+-binding RTX toxin-like protein
MANISPQVDLNGADPGTGNSVAFTENDPQTPIAPAATVVDPDSPDFDGGTLTVEITAGAGPNDRLLINPGNFMISDQDILYRFTTDEDPFYEDRRIASFFGGTDGSTPLVITFTDQATPDLVQQLTRLIAFGNFSDAPVAGDRTITFTLTDGDGGASDPATATVSLAATDDPATAQPDHVFANEDAPATGSVFDDNGSGPDSDPDGTITVSEVNGSGANVGHQIELDSGALLTVFEDGTYNYDPNGAFDYLVAGGTGAVNSQADDSFKYRVEGGNEVTVTVTVSGVYSPGDTLAGTSDNDTLTGTGNADLFDVSQGGTDSVSGNDGDDYIYFGDAFSPGDTANGGNGFDVVALLGNTDIVLGAGSLVGVERLTLFSGPSLGGETHVSYDITSNDGNVAPGQTLTVFAAYLLSDETLTFNGMAEKDGSFQIYGGAGDDILVGGQQNDTIVGNAGADELYGLGGNDWLAGGGGADTLRGGFGSDIFVFRSGTDSTVEAPDLIVDFEQTKDLINLEAIDAKAGLEGNQAFTFIGSDAFSHTAGELRAYQLEGQTWAVEGDLDADGVADFYIQVHLVSETRIVATDFMLCDAGRFGIGYHHPVRG